MMNTNFCLRLQSARKGAGISTRALSEHLKKRGFIVSHATIANYESGKTIPPLPLLVAISEICGLPINWFLQSAGILTNISYRALKKVPVRDKNHFESNAQRWLEAYRNIETYLGQPLRNRISNFSAIENESGMKLAEKLRVQLQLGDLPVSNVIEILHSFGIRVITLDGIAGIDGLAATLKDESVVVLNSTLSNDRIRLNAAHELGHHLYALFTQYRQDNEKLAFEFASNFLMPLSKLKAAFDGYSMLRLIEYKKQYGISLSAMIYRAQQENLLPSGTYKMLWCEFIKRGWRKNEPGHVGPDRPVRFEQLLEGAIRTRVLTWAKAAAITRISETELRERLAKAVKMWLLNSEGGQD
jgi:Zn-dependent peptidase ImmA (M78 family)